MAAASGFELPQGSGEHPINWVEFVARDLDRATYFFSSVFGWEMRPFTDGYCTFTDKGGYGGGINASRPEQPLRSYVYIEVDSVEGALERVAAAGGEAVAPKIVIDPESGGGIGFIRDPCGLLIGVADVKMQGLPTPNPFGPEKPVDGAICSVELYGGDFSKTRPFYEELFGWALSETMPGYMSLGPGRGLSGVFQNHSPSAEALLYVWVDDLPSVAAKIEAAGGNMIGGGMGVPGYGTFAYYRDCEGAMQGLISR